MSLCSSLRSTLPLAASLALLAPAVAAAGNGRGSSAANSNRSNCPCTSMARQALSPDASVELYALSWQVYWAAGTTEHTSLRSYFWEQDGDGLWSSPTVGADAYRDTAEGGQPYCEVWSRTWLAAPTHGWADDEVSTAIALTESQFDACEASLDRWIDNGGIDLTSF